MFRNTAGDAWAISWSEDQRELTEYESGDFATIPLPGFDQARRHVEARIETWRREGFQEVGWRLFWPHETDWRELHARDPDRVWAARTSFCGVHSLHGRVSSARMRYHDRQLSTPQAAARELLLKVRRKLRKGFVEVTAPEAFDAEGRDRKTGKREASRLPTQRVKDPAYGWREFHDQHGQFWAVRQLGIRIDERNGVAHRHRPLEDGQSRLARTSKEGERIVRRLISRRLREGYREVESAQ